MNKYVGTAKRITFAARASGERNSSFNLDPPTQNRTNNEVKPSENIFHPSTSSSQLLFHSRALFIARVCLLNAHIAGFPPFVFEQENFLISCNNFFCHIFSFSSFDNAKFRGENLKQKNVLSEDSYATFRKRTSLFHYLRLRLRNLMSFLSLALFALNIFPQFQNFRNFRQHKTYFAI